MIQFQITNIDSICNFIYEIYSRYGEKFDPAQAIGKLEHFGRPVFSKKEAEYLDSIMTECFIYCVLNGVNIYTLASIVECDIIRISYAA